MLPDPSRSDSLPAQLHRLRPWLDARRRHRPLEALQSAAPPRGTAYATRDPSSTAPAASFNENRIYLLGAEGGLRQEGLAQLADWYRQQGIGRFFVWLSPGPMASEVGRWLESQGLALIPWTRYPVMMLARPPAQVPGTDLAVREVSADEVRAAAPLLDSALSADCLASAGQPGMLHFMAFDGGTPVAVAALALFEDLGYLTFAGTHPAHGGRGAQQALIAARVARAQQAGCASVASETLSMLPHSMKNLERLGFVEVHDKRVYRFGGD
jgi:GNAT superfamily N-acetyltransferase